MCEILIKAVDATHPDSDKDKRGSYKKGYPVVVKPDGWEWGNLETLPKFVIVKCPEVGVAAAETYMQQWNRSIDYEVVVHQVPTDGYRIRVYSSNMSVSNEGGLTKANIENYLTAWGCVVQSFTATDVTFDVSIELLVQSDKFYEKDNLTTTETAYDEGTGVHRFSTDYSYYDINEWPPARVEARVEENGGTVISHDTENGIIVYDIGRADVLNRFKQEVKERISWTVYRRRYYFLEADVDTAIAAGGIITLTQAQLMNKLNDKLDD